MTRIVGKGGASSRNILQESRSSDVLGAAITIRKPVIP